MEVINMTREQAATENLALMMRGWDESAERERQKRGKKKVRRKKQASSTTFVVRHNGACDAGRARI